MIGVRERHSISMTNDAPNGQKVLMRDDGLSVVNITGLKVIPSFL